MKKSKYIFKVYQPGYGGRALVLYALTRLEFMKLFEPEFKIVLGKYDKREHGYIIVGLRKDGIKYPFGWVNRKRCLKLPRMMIEYSQRHLYG